MAKMTATENAQQIIDMAVQMHGVAWASGREHIVESLYREIRALRIYEGATEVQQLIIARELLKDLKG
jgi:acyl-CoA dehydrogenase